MKKSPEIQRTSKAQSAQNKVQTKLKVGEPGDKHEQQADAVADQVMKMPVDEEKISRMPVEGSTGGIMMSPEEEESVQMSPEEEESVQMSPEEEESVQMSDDEDSVQMTEEEESVQMNEEDESVQMTEDEEAVSAKEEEEISMKPMIQRSGDGQAVASPGLVNTINASKGGGRNLPDHVNSEMSRKIGSDFSKVRVHTDARAKEMNEGLGAKAFAHGNDVYFNKGNYNPNQPEGKRLLAHELTHVVQQKGRNRKKINTKLICNSKAIHKDFKWLLPKDYRRSIKFNRKKPYDVSVKKSKKIYDAYRLKIVAKIASSSENVKVVKGPKSHVIPNHKLLDRGNVINDSMPGEKIGSYGKGFSGGGITIPSLELAKSVNPHYSGPATSVPNESWVFYVSEEALIHELGHIYLWLSGVPGLHSTTIKKSDKIEAADGTVFSGKAIDFLKHSVNERGIASKLLKGLQTSDPHFSPSIRQTFETPDKGDVKKTWSEIKVEYPKSGYKLKNNAIKYCIDDGSV
ncbi:MAG: DUF4157 domain-containing protein, partial [Cyclobacteriaceae bacterium]